MANELMERNIADNVLNRVAKLEESGGLVIPPNYSAANALKSAWLILQETKDRNKKPVLEVCTKESICNTLLDMVIQGLSPVKKQCYFIAYGNQLQLSRSYMGTVAVTKRLSGIKDVFANCIYEGDVFEYEFDLETGVKRITKHEQKFENINIQKIRGAYAVIVREGAENFVEVMSMDQIRQSWKQRKGPEESDTHKNFTDEMAKKTVISRACKIFANTSDDADLLIESINRTDRSADEVLPSTEPEQPIGFDAKAVVDVECEPVEETPEMEAGEPEQEQMAGPGF